MSAPDTSPPPPPGWYTNPAGPGQRYWDGQKWTDSYSQTQPSTVSNLVTEPDSSSSGLIVAGYIFAVVIPIVGFILGIVAVTRPDKRVSKHGVWIIVLSVVAFFVFVAIIAGSAGTSSTSGG